jgi:hypothetical protein
MIADERTAHQIVRQDLNIRKMCAQMVTKLEITIEKHAETNCQQKCLNGSKVIHFFLNRVITGDESLFLEYDLEI